MSRPRVFVLCLACAILSPLLVLMMLAQVLAGSVSRAMSMAIAFDQVGNSLFGGSERETISRRTGLAAIAGKPWAIWLAPKIDALFGAGHCAENAAAE